MDIRDGTPDVIRSACKSVTGCEARVFETQISYSPHQFSKSIRFGNLEGNLSDLSHDKKDKYWLDFCLGDGVAGFVKDYYYRSILMNQRVDESQMCTARDPVVVECSDIRGRRTISRAVRLAADGGRTTPGGISRPEGARAVFLIDREVADRLGSTASAVAALRRGGTLPYAPGLPPVVDELDLLAYQENVKSLLTLGQAAVWLRCRLSRPGKAASCRPICREQ